MNRLADCSASGFSAMMTARRPTMPLRTAAALTIVLAISRTVVAADPATQLAPARQIPAGVYEFNRTIVIPRQRRLPRISNKAESGVPAPYLAKSVSQPGGWLRGEDRFGTVLRFAPSVTGTFIKTEGYGEGHV